MSLHDRTEAVRVAARPAAARRGLGLALLIIATAQLMLVLDDTIVNVALPSMQRSLHLPASSLNWVISFYALAFGGLLLVGGRAGDLFGRLRVFRIGIVVFTCASGVRSIKAAEISQAAGFAYDAHLAGGVKSWKGAGLPVET